MRGRQRQRHADLIHRDKGRIGSEFAHCPGELEHAGTTLGSAVASAKNAFSRETRWITFFDTADRNSGKVRASANSRF